MKKYLFGVWIINWVLVFSFAHALGQENRGPKIVLKEQVFDFQEVKEGAVIDHTFQVFNDGDEILRIEKVKPG